MKAKSFLKPIALITLFLWLYSFVHIVHMGMRPSEDCPHAQDSHALCKLVVSNQALEKIVSKKHVAPFLLVSSIFFATYIAFTSSRFFTKQGNQKPSVLQELFSAGILNPKAP